MLKSNPEMAVEIPEQFFLVQKFTAVSSAQWQDFYLLLVGKYSGIQNGKCQEPTNSTLYITSFFSVNRRIKKNMYKNSF
jgi:hypothetical protein